MEINIEPAYRELKTVRLLFEEYREMLGVDLGFQDYAGELAELPGKYAPPGGGLYLAFADGKPAGCGAFRRYTQEICELKRLFVRPGFRGAGIATRLISTILSQARAAGYQKIYLDTLGTLESAFCLYQRLGFQEIPPYYDNPLPGARYFCMQLS